ncbi:unnamed protein product (macronuclear) [Paramecium tetraurelia]|uniref:CSC1/OSCA1-like cytosolic domain-containing protein n=1 Tax=Paramecium tetraurelia TaxID=5888 RepID=A0C0M4_PARTE|nr:uncharacterized protein GSPATT00006194001 [Paramecium tetraurelia]CAK64341.1 unnamed protein product [Paramecium tetraurelia]|eukprot:XP_001431739.1 hypothetical protein (macronuclear) [Paramecium tetraurelia strain d4-2]
MKYNSQTNPPSNFQHFMGVAPNQFSSNIKGQTLNSQQQNQHDQSRVSQMPVSKIEEVNYQQSHEVNHSHIDLQQHSSKAQHYHPLTMPCNWDLARKHAQSRRTALEKKKDFNKTTNVETCPCCGFEVERDEIPYCSNPMALSFLGSGFTLFYNYLKYCIIILFITLVTKQIYNLYTSYEGSYCSHVKKEKIEGHVVELPNCSESLFLRLSLANKLDNREALEHVQILNFINLFIVMLVLIYFRKSQRQIDTTIDEELLTPADYTVCVKNIPLGLGLNYKWELKHMFETCAVISDTNPIVVKKVVLVYDIEEIIEMEKKLDELVERKKDIIKEYNYNFNHPKVLEIDQKIKEFEHKIHQTEKEYEKENKKFAGIAFISFEDENMKNLVLQENQHTQLERMKSYWNKGKLEGLSENDLSWHDQKLFIEQAPEPNEVDWEFIHVKTEEKISKRVKAWIIYLLVESAAFYSIYLISHKVAKYGDEAREEEIKGKLDHNTMLKINILSFIISLSIVLFNKFAVAKIVHYIVDDEKISSKTKFQISFVYKYALALFLNAAIISFLVDIVILKNVEGAGGFLQNESQIFILNAVLPPFIWCVDPWSLCKNIWRWYIVSKGDKALLTQQEANTLMEEPDYLSAKRYSDIMKTMWFTFLYGTAIPLGTVCSAFGILIYYYVDYYNILRRRTVKESISIQLSTEMIEMLEYIIVWSAFGEMIMTYAFFKEISSIDVLLMVIAIIYASLPMEDISEYLFPVVNNEEIKPYDEGCLGFDTDYDRENPVTRHKAIEEWNEKQNMLIDSNHKIHKYYQQQDQFGYNNDAHYGRR